MILVSTRRSPAVRPSEAFWIRMMSPTTFKQQRLRLFDRGNNRCPICLMPFTRQDVERGKATLEHVPPRAFDTNSIGMCLTCAACNNDAGRVEQAAAEALRDGEKVQIHMPGLVDEKGQPLVHTAYGAVSGNGPAPPNAAPSGLEERVR